MTTGMNTASRAIRRTFAVVLAVASLTAVACSSDSRSTTPTPFTAEDGRFSAEFPGTPKRDQQQVSAAGLDLVVVLYATETDDESVMVGYTDYPVGMTSEGVLDAAAQGSAQNVKGTITGKTDVTFLGHPAKDVTVTTDDALINERLFLVDNRMYTLLGVAKDSRPASYDHLLETFKLL